MSSAESTPDSRSPLRDVLQDAVWYAVAKGGAGILGLLLVVFLARGLGSAGYAQLSIVLASSMALAQWGCGWLYHGTMRYGAGGKLPAVQVGLGLALSLAAAAPFAWIGLSGGGLQAYFWLAVCLAVCCALYSLQLALLQVRLQVRRVAWVESARALIALVITGALVYGASGSPLTCLLAVAASYATLVVVTWCVPLEGGATALRSASRWRSYFSYGWPLALWMGGFSSLPLLDRTVLVQFHGLAFAGDYASVGDVVTRGFALLLFPLGLAAHARAVNCIEDQAPLEARRLIWKTLKVQALLFLAAVGLAMFLGPWLLGYLLPDAPADRWLLGLLACTAAAWQAALLLQKPVELSGNTIWLPLLLVIAALVQWGLLGWWVPSMAAHGAALAGLTSALLYCALCGALGWTNQSPPTANKRESATP